MLILRSIRALVLVVLALCWPAAPAPAESPPFGLRAYIQPTGPTTPLPSDGMPVTDPSFASPALAGEHLLYASDGQWLFTVDPRTGELTFQTDGPARQWIADPAFDEERHTRFWIVGNEARDLGWNPFAGAQYYWGNPTTGQTDGPLPATVTPPAIGKHPDGNNGWIDDDPSQLSMFANGPVVYDPSRERLYAPGLWKDQTQFTLTDWGHRLVFAEIDQFNGPKRDAEHGGFWVGYAAIVTGTVRSLAATFDPIGKTIVFGSTFDSDSFTSRNTVSLSEFDPDSSFGIFRPERAFSMKIWFSSSFNPMPDVFLQALAVDPKSGALYALFYIPSHDPNRVYLGMITPYPYVTINLIRDWPYRQWHMAFASEKYIR
jgi:hypothetical protein